MKGRSLLLGLMFGSVALFAQQPVQKTNPMKVYMHYMPWFETPETIGVWGWHWTMNSKDPNVIEGGKRQIAAHYYPLIGPYASRDQDVIEYHLLLMKLSGVDGVLINWYGSQGSNGDVQHLLRSSNEIIAHVDDVGLQFGVVLEDRFSRTSDNQPNIDYAKANVRYLKNNYFTKPEYIRHGEAQTPLLPIFGPITFQDPAQWTEILAEAGEDVEFLPLWYEAKDAGANADGEYSWVYQDPNTSNHLTQHLNNFYVNRAPQLKTAMGSAYPGFHDFYKEGGAGAGYHFIPHNDGATLDQTLAKANEHKNKIDMLQLVTWNDFGEGTIFEPTWETGFEYLKKVQAFTGVSYGEQELTQVYKLFTLRKEHAADAAVQQQLDQASVHFANLQIQEAVAILTSIDPAAPVIPTNPAAPTGLLDGSDSGSTKNSLDFSVYPNPAGDTTVQLELAKSSPKAAKVSVLDASGKLVFRKKIPAGTTALRIPTEELSNGIYIIKIETNDMTGTQRLIITK